MYRKIGEVSEEPSESVGSPFRSLRSAFEELYRPTERQIEEFNQRMEKF